jgi:hypothetical protein
VLQPNQSLLSADARESLGKNRVFDTSLAHRCKRGPFSFLFCFDRSALNIQRRLHPVASAIMEVNATSASFPSSILTAAVMAADAMSGLMARIVAGANCWTIVWTLFLSAVIYDQCK